ncbi:hypothetical protein [Chitinophaga sp.]|uniref:hypothetical protein n=1 Tax=Chitinophaga sp. TaxID=1869181 RepID=UPI00260E62E1|nr:hypothetical protein [uncultured Chitinophaga sp.]
MIGFVVNAQAQVNTVEFGQNRVQYKNFKWRFYTTRHFNTYFAQNGLELGKYVAQAAERELPQLEEFMEFTFRQKVNIIVYNNFAEFKQSNVGIGVDWQNTGGVTKLVGNKLLVYFDGDHANLRRQIRQGIARVMLETLLFGEDIGEFAGNAVLMDFPNWFTDGFIAYAAENWNPQLDDQLKAALNSGKYNTFNQLTFDKPLLAGQAFWYYVESKYGKDAVPYLMYITRINRGLKKGFEQVLHMKPKAAQADFMIWWRKRFQEDGRRRRQVTRGTGVISNEIGKKDYYRYAPNPKNSMYAVVEYSKGTYKVKINLGWTTNKVLLKSGVKQLTSKLDPNYPLLAWNHKGNRLAVVYEHEGKTRLMVYDLISKITIRQDLPMFDRIIDMKFFFEFDNSLLLSAVRNGHTDIFTYSMTNSKVDQITNDVWDDLDPSFAAFPGKSGIIYSSNRPGPKARTSDTALPHNRYNVFMVDNWNKSSEKQISQLTDLPYGNARLPVQYNTTHFTFVSDANGVSNRYAGFFRAEKAGVDSLYFIGAEILHNPDKEELDSALMDYGATAPDSIQAVAITNDSTYVFPVTNYQYGIKESRIAGDQGMVSEVVQIGDWKRLYKLKVDTNTLRRRNVSARPTNFRLQQMRDDSMRLGLPSYYAQPDTSKQANFFQNEFGNEPAEPAAQEEQPMIAERKEPPVLKSARLSNYRLKFSSDYLVTQIDNSVLMNRYQPYYGWPQGPIRLTDPVNGLIRIGVSDLMEDVKFSGAFRVPLALDGTEYMFSMTYLKKRFDYKLTYYRRMEKLSFRNENSQFWGYPSKNITNIYQGEVRYPFDQVRSIRLSAGLRRDETVVLGNDSASIMQPNYKENAVLARLEYVHDNVLNPAINIYKGTRFKIYGDLIAQVSSSDAFFDQKSVKGKFTYNMGIDARHYVEIHRNFIWATRIAADLSWGSRKLIYFLGGVDNWMVKPDIYYNRAPNENENYAYQTLAVNMRGYKQNIRNGNNVLLMNTELRLPVFTTFIDKPINSAFLRNFQLTTFMDIGTAWNEKLKFKGANYTEYVTAEGVVIRIKEGFLGPFVGGYGFGARTTLLGYFVRFDAGWPMTGFFRGKPQLTFGLGVDF